ncbi:Uncharacterized conserved protein UCP014543 [Macleaya cordata]|uniref:Uncharacterized conserved protein UCP014543 n=1 Tax=Macleaya cordata TaxID=56857 RepID=A0A200R5J7_MACCD|nr:Uncharacterized conserved protein UCP014543 [Macleaya cordata]
MASALLTVQSFSRGFSANRDIKFLGSPISSVFISPSARISQIPTFSLSRDTLKQLSRASPEGIPIELIEDSKFVPLNADDLRYGPPALLLLGFEMEETGKIQELLKEMDGEFMKIIHCTEDMISCSLWEAMNTQQLNLEEVKIAKSVPRICFLSGLTGEEMMMFIDAFEETGLEPVVFAALVPNSADKPLQELMEEIMGDHEMMTANQSDSR